MRINRPMISGERNTIETPRRLVSVWIDDAAIEAMVRHGLLAKARTYWLEDLETAANAVFAAAIRRLGRRA